MCGFGRTSKDPLADRRTFERWFALFPPNDPLAIHGELMTELGRHSQRNARRTPARLEAVFYADTQTRTLRRTLTGQ